ncbi:TetR/AcrR family transcriptional regulator [Caulobacter vibrioides]|uniref:Transcriptional regulator, TetR family n=2 Tax=Caulobacter vibrioides TaxID=155892 RepID=Q9A9I8_CAUVC|nr:TetR/AcrR family transcriptional regulator [Caulobacter vibrioides]YP_002516417.1 AcrR-family transcriptional regulator [Caulobacter vibrioides NA1000]AAK22976.1 transcriptional regulator, TetR family [Caulobacter vibrioides CB15]ACL94509.1 AcrR-family transcriptional regulator [Caulobacter vibrioides NA1000]ATC27827.1 TetR/AcrR family transcriptional regulator [Caulobacter vibrioides]QXZ53069.1 TetR/AcrR family transcriptional regulator [Caulobacter vibrioides]
MSKGGDPGLLTDEVRPLAQSQKSMKKREEILRAAIKIINTKGFAAATMTEIAAAIDLRDAALYYYFPNKQALAYTGHQRSLERFEAILIAVEAGGGTGLCKLRRFLHAVLEDGVVNGPQLYFGDHSYLDAAQQRAIDTWTVRLAKRLERFLEEGMADGTIATCEPRLVVQLLVGMLIWLTKWTPTTPGLTNERLLDAIETTALSGLAKPS